MARRVRSAGILLCRRPAADGLEFLLAHPGGPYWARRDAGAWSIPKGELEDGEEPRQCALRELAEELGPAPRLEPERLLDLGTVRQKILPAQAPFLDRALDLLLYSRRDGKRG